MRRTHIRRYGRGVEDGFAGGGRTVPKRLHFHLRRRGLRPGGETGPLLPPVIGPVLVTSLVRTSCRPSTKEGLSCTRPSAHTSPSTTPPASSARPTASASPPSPDLRLRVDHEPGALSVAKRPSSSSFLAVGSAAGVSSRSRSRGRSIRRTIRRPIRQTTSGVRTFLLDARRGIFLRRTLLDRGSRPKTSRVDGPRRIRRLAVSTVDLRRAVTRGYRLETSHRRLMHPGA
jgi:hypothetical protein